MAPSRKEKTNNDLEEALFKFESKKDELYDYFEGEGKADPNPRRFNIGVVEATLQELVGK